LVDFTFLATLKPKVVGALGLLEGETVVLVQEIHKGVSSLKLEDLGISLVSGEIEDPWATRRVIMRKGSTV
jgi:hypothetical protein